jgi:hypothetical protein
MTAQFDNDVIDKYFNNYDALTYFNNIEFDSGLEYFLNDYKVNKHDKTFNSKVFILLSLKLKSQLEDEYQQCLQSLLSDKIGDLDKCIELSEKFQQSRYTQLTTYDKHYKLINQIKKRYNIPIQKEILITK